MAKRKPVNAAEYDAVHGAEMEKRLANLWTQPATETPEGEQPDRAARFIHRDKIEPNPEQPREFFDDDSLKTLGQSLKTLGQITPIMVRPHPNGSDRYQIIAGERRWRATAPEFGDLEAVRCIVRQADDREALVLALTENEEREDIRALEQAKAFERLRNFAPGRKMSNEQLGEQLAMHHSRVARILKLLELPEIYREDFDRLQLNEKHGRALLDLSAWPEVQRRLWREIKSAQLSGNAAGRRARELKSEIKPAASISEASTSQGQGAASTSAADSGAGSSQRSHSATPPPSSPPFSYGSGMDRTASEAPRPASSGRPDLLETILIPLVNFAAEGARVLRTITPSADYRRDCLARIERTRELLDAMERELE